MPQGLQLWDQSGNLVLDTSTFTIKNALYDSGAITTTTTVTVSSITSTTQVAAEISGIDPDIPSVTINTAAQQVTVSGGGTYSARFYLFDIP